MKALERIFWISILSIVIACATGSPPSKPFETIHYIPEYEIRCLWYLKGNDMVLTCPGDNDYPENTFVITVEGYEKEIGYQHTLINSCKRWK